MLKQLTPVLVVDEVEPCLAFWTGGLGLAPVHRIPGPDGRLMFASVEKDGIEVMYQTRASVVEDHPAMAADLNGHSIVLFLTVDDLDQVAKAVAGAPVVKPRHKTFYGSEEIYVKEPGGHTVGFAQMAG
jgi:uncharacterized glyoxalase superfamily protein PhnB